MASDKLRRAARFLGSARRDYSLFVNVYFVFTNMSNTGHNSNTGNKDKDVPANNNGGNTASNSSGRPFLGYNLLTLFQLEVLRLMFIAMSTLRYYVIVDAYSTLSMLKLITFTTITGSNPIEAVSYVTDVSISPIRHAMEIYQPGNQEARNSSSLHMLELLKRREEEDALALVGVAVYAKISWRAPMGEDNTAANVDSLFRKARWKINAPGFQLRRRHVPAMEGCIFCGHDDRIEHVFLVCPYAATVWKAIKEKFQINLCIRELCNTRQWVFDFLTRSSLIQKTVLAVTP
uniref:Retrotransposon protein, putative, Ty1-copia subclass n=2 Tax=Oryza sativa subsp. japonica TaxID=39947 RepID=Q53PW4_ORYSJ|nr:hypothetical protein [Oryza sativa Japonica Group]ABA92641.2 retrotransposon protein, putative, Ty1-copia subclass [Oryza sativa Japonica Group]